MSTDNWAEGDAYERYVGRWSRPVARDFVAWLDRPAGLKWLDVGCGTGALSASILAARRAGSGDRRRFVGRLSRAGASSDR
jgi:2-polyprenyl-3-methyl-5-hydroxy-6-metoxy-1,4-benzoquinol methylase